LATACGGRDPDQATRGNSNTAASHNAGQSSGSTGGQGSANANSSLGSTDSSAGGAAPAQQMLDRKLIRTATMTIETDAVSQKFEDIGNIAVSSGGLVFSSQFGNDGNRQTASITIRVPNARYEDVLAQLRRLGYVRNENSNANDVTEQYTDLQSNLTNLQATEREYLKLLTQAQSIDNILVVQDRINGTRSQIDQIQGRLNLMTNQTDLATITAHLTPPIASPADEGTTSISEVAKTAFASSLAVLRGLTIAAVAIAAFAWWLLPLAGVGGYLGWRQRKLDRARAEVRPPGAS
jgi:hypothetical protein